MGLFQDIRRGNIEQLNNAYRGIKAKHVDEYLGIIMLFNDWDNNSSLLEATAQTMYQLFFKADINKQRKSEIISNLKLKSSDLNYGQRDLQRYIRMAHGSFNVELFTYYQRAYQESAGGNHSAFRNAAMDYRLGSQEMGLYLTALDAQSRQLTLYLESDLCQINYLWNLYKESSIDRIKEILVAALATHISFDDEKSIQAYIGSVDAVKRLIERITK